MMRWGKQTRAQCAERHYIVLLNEGEILLLDEVGETGEGVMRWNDTTSCYLMRGKFYYLMRWRKQTRA